MRTENNFNPSLVLRNIIPNPEPEDISRLWPMTTSIIVLRHPMDRRVSLYNNKFLHRVEDNKLWAGYTAHIREHYRDEDEDDFQYITPEEMIR